MIGGKFFYIHKKVLKPFLRSSHREYIETFPVDNLNGNHEDTLKNIIFDYLKHQGMPGDTYILISQPNI